MKALLTRANLTAHFAAAELGRYAINGIYFTPRGSVSTDGRKMLVVPYPNQAMLDEWPEGNPAGEFSAEFTSTTVPADDQPVLVPLDVCLTVAKGLGRPKGPNRHKSILWHAVLESAAVPRVSAVDGSVSQSGRQYPARGRIAINPGLNGWQNYAFEAIDAEFPDWEDAVPRPTTNNRRVSFGRENLEGLLKAMKAAESEVLTMEFPSAWDEYGREAEYSSAVILDMHASAWQAGECYGALMPIST